MEEPSNAIVPVSILPKNVYGLRSEVVGNIHFSYNQEVIYPVESVLVFHDFSTNKQRFLRLPEHTVPTFITINSSRRLLAVVEYATFSDGKTATNISVYDTCTLKKRRNFQLPEDSKNDKIVQITFVQDSRALVILSMQQTLYMMFFDKTGTIAENQVGQANQRVRATCIACNPHDMGLVAVCGESVIKMFSKTETGFSMSAVKFHFNVKCLAWLSMEMLLLGLKKNKMALIDNGELKQTFRATEMDLIDLSKDPDLEEETLQEEQYETKSISTEDVRCIVSLSKLLAYTLSDEVYVFEKTSKYKYQRLAIIKRHLGVYSEDLYKIDNLAINPQQDTVIATAKHSQIYVANLKGIQVGEGTTYLRFSPLGVLLHIDEIVDISICSWKPIIMTASKDQTIRVWNYETESLELVKRYQVDISVTELNPTGQLAAVGFSDQLRIMQIFLTDLHIFKTYNFPRCSQVRYSFFGHMMAAAYDNFVSITSVYTLDILKTLKGHNGDVLSLAWSRDDKYLISGGAEGAIYQWDVETGARIHEIVQKGTEYRALCCTGTDPISIYAATGSGLLRELSKSEMVRELSTVKKTPFLSLDLARSDLMLFLSTEAGHLYNVQLPFLDAGGGTFTNYRFFDSAVTKVAFSYDDTLLITASKRGTLAIWFLQNIEGKVSPLDQDLLKGQEVLIPRHVLREKIEQISSLEIRLQQQAAEFAYQESQNEIFDSQQLADIHKGYCQALEALKNINSELEQKHIQELNEITFRINDLKAEHKRQIQNLSEQFTEQMLMEYQKYTSFSQSSKEIKETFENKLRKSAGTLQDTVEALEVDNKKQLEQRQELIRELMQEIQDEKFEFYEYCRQVAAENETNMADTVIKYENLIKREQDEEVVWRGKAGVLKKMADTMSKQVEHLLEDVVLLNEERVKSQKTIDCLRHEIENLRKEISERESAINLKEKRIQEVFHRNQDLEKYKQLFSFKITELKMQIEPREYQINEKQKKITQLEQQLDALNKANVQIEAKIKTLTEKHMQASDDLGKQRSLAKRSREFIYTICTDIYNVSGKINDAGELTTGVDELYKKYAKDDALKKHIQLESQVQTEFNRQRSHMEKSISDCKQKLNIKVDVDQSASLLKENIKLLGQIELLRKKNVNLTRDHSIMSANLKLPARKSTVMQQKLGLILEEIEVRRLKRQGKLQTLQGELDTLMSKNQMLTRELEELTDFTMPIEKSETIAQL